MSTLLINANQPEEIRIALLEPAEAGEFNELPAEETNRDKPPAYRRSLKGASGSVNKKSRIVNLYIENTLKKSSLKNIYAGIVRSVEPSLNAAFIEFGSERHGFLPFKEISSEYSKHKDSQNIKYALRVGQTIIVQVKKEERGTKGAALTTYITLPGSYLVLMPNNPSAGGISKRISGEERKIMQEVVEQLNLPPSMGVIFRTAGMGRPIDIIQRDLALLIKQWEAIQEAFRSKKAPFLIFQESDILARAIRDYLREDIEKIVVDNPTVFEKLKNYTSKIRHDLLDKLQLYKSREPLFLHFGIEEEVESAFQSSLRLPSGGTIIFNRFEALVAIDINSGGSTKHEDIAETAFKTNLEAAEMIASQLRLRDLGGLIVIDFIDMEEEAHKREVEAKLKEAIKEDRARIQMGSISSFGLLEMSRQRLRSSLGKMNEDVCLACQGHGIRRSVESLALSAIRSIEKVLFSKKVKQIRLESSLELATYLGNEKRAIIAQLEKEHRFTLLLLPNPYWEATQYKLTTFDKEDLTASTVEQPGSYALLSEKSHEAAIISSLEPKEIPAVQNFEHQASPKSTQKSGIVKSVLGKLAQWGHIAIHAKKADEKPALQYKEETKKRGAKPLNPRNAVETRSKTTTVIEESRPARAARRISDHSPQAAGSISTTSAKQSSISNKLSSEPSIAKKRVSEKSVRSTPNQRLPLSKTPPEKTVPLADHVSHKKQETVIILKNDEWVPLKSKIVNRYGGEASLQRRSYTTVK